MKKMFCEICGSQSIRKESGVFVCQECGTEYSLEEAKKLLRDVEDSKAVVVTNDDNKLFKNENTDVNGKDELIFELYLWAKNLSSLKDVSFWFNKPTSIFTNEAFWSVSKPFNNENKTSLFPSFNNLETADKDEENYIKRIYSGKKLSSIFNKEILQSSGFNKMLNKLYSYSSEVTNSSYDLHHRTACKYRVCANDRHICNLDFEYGRIRQNPNEIFNIGLGGTNFEIYYSEFSRMWGTEKVYHALDVENFLKGFVKKAEESEKLFIQNHNNEMAVYQDKLNDVAAVYNEIIDNCRTLEKSLFLPYKYRKLETVMSLIDIVRSGKATNWKELINLYDTQVYRENVVFELKVINENLATINQTLIKGFLLLDTRLNQISSQLDSLDSKMSLIEKSLSDNLSDISRNTFITMWNSL